MALKQQSVLTKDRDMEKQAVAGLEGAAQRQIKLGFIGVGYMGRRIAARLIAQGYHLALFNRTRATAESLAGANATVAASVAELAAGADVILSCLANDEVVREVFSGPQGVMAKARPGTVVIEMSTVCPETSQELFREGARHGIPVLDVAISGSTPAAEQGTLTLLGGGDEKLFMAAEPIFRCFAKQWFYMGPSGSGTTMKLVINALLGVGMQAIAEAVALGWKAGLDRDRLLDVLAKTAVIAPAHLGKLATAKQNDYRPQFPVRLMNKDYRLMMEKAAETHVAMPVTAAAFQINTAETAAGLEEDFSAVVRMMAVLAGLK